MRKYWFRHKWLSVFTIITYSVKMLMNVVIAFLISGIIDIVLEGNKSSIVFYIFFVIIYLGVFLFIGFLSDFFQCKHKKAIRQDLRREVIEGIIEQSFDNDGELQDGEYLSIINNDIELVEESYIDGFLVMFGEIVTCIISVASMVMISSKSIIFIMILIIPYMFITVFMSKELSRCKDEWTTAIGKYISIIKSMIHGRNIINNYNAVYEFENVLDNANKEEAEKKGALEYKLLRLQTINVSSGQVIVILMVILCAIIAMNDEISLGQVVAMSQLIATLIVPISSVSDSLGFILSSKEIKEKVLSFTDKKRLTQIIFLEV